MWNFKRKIQFESDNPLLGILGITLGFLILLTFVLVAISLPVCIFLGLCYLLWLCLSGIGITVNYWPLAGLVFFGLVILNLFTKRGN